MKYIENTDLQYIDTLFCANQDTRILCECVIKDEFKSNYYQGLFGATDYDEKKEFNRNVVHMHKESSTNLIVMSTYGSDVQCVGYSGDIRKKHIYELDKNVYKVDGNIIYTYPESTFECTNTINIFRDNNNIKSSQNKRCCKMKLYSFKIYDNKTLVRDFVPCYCAKSVKDVTGKLCPPNTAGLYDIVNNEFYTNQGNDDFRMEKTHEFGNLLPDDMEIVQYIEGTGKQYIDIDLNAKDHPNIIVEIEGNFTNTKNNQYIFGAGFHNDYKTDCTWSLIGLINGSNFIAHDGISGKEKELTTADIQKHIFVLDTVSSIGKVDNTSESLDSQGKKEVNYNYVLFALNNHGSIVNKASFKMYSCKITENNTIIRNYIPCLDADGNACMYDTVSKQCVYNKGTEEFKYE